MLLSPAINVKAKALTPQQQPTSVGFKRHTDCYERMMVKHPHRSVFHSLAELYYAALLEADPLVTFYVPQPFLLRVNRKRYVPDFYVLKNERRQVIELKPRAEFDDQIRIPLESFFNERDMDFLVENNSDVMERSMEAENWLTILSALTSTSSASTEPEEQTILSNFYSVPRSLMLGEIIEPSDRIQSINREIGLFRLLHRGVITADLNNEPLDYSTKFSLCA